jgi:5-hydroxyisourate hydrolase-like protein (transthyretin family)
MLLLAQDTTATLSGEVRDITGAAIPATNAELRLEDPPRTISSVRTDNQGRFQFTVLPSGTYALELFQPGFRTLTLKSIRLGSGEHKMLPSLRLDVGVCGEPPIDYIELLRTEQHVGNLRGHVLRQQRHYPGPAIAHATVKLLCDEREVCGETKTDSNGEFMFSDLPPGKNFTIGVTHPGYYLLEERTYEVQAGFKATYWPITLEHCPNGNCDPRLRPQRPLGLCE